MAFTNLEVPSAIQLGTNIDPTKNLAIFTNQDGTFTIARGIPENPGPVILSIGADNSISMPGSVVTFSAWQSVGQPLPADAFTKLLCTNEEFDVGGFYDTALSRFQPDKAGYYHFGGGFQVATTASIARIFVYKNGVLYKQASSSTPSTDWTYGSCTVYLNGSTDYLELFAWTNVTNTTHPLQVATYIQGHMVARA